MNNGIILLANKNMQITIGTLKVFTIKVKN